MSINIGNDVQEWLDSLKEDSIPSLDEMPASGLLMEQTLKYLQKALEPYNVEDDEKLVTSYMINNYVKDGTIPAPDKKKYSRDHLAYLISICLLKQVVSLDDISFILNLDANSHNDDHYELFKIYKLYHDKEYEKLSQEFKEDLDFAYKTLDSKLGTPSNDEKQKVYDEKLLISLAYIAFKNAITAEAHKMLAKKLISEVKKNYSQKDMKNFKNER